MARCTKHSKQAPKRGSVAAAELAEAQRGVVAQQARGDTLETQLAQLHDAPPRANVRRCPVWWIIHGPHCIHSSVARTGTRYWLIDGDAFHVPVGEAVAAALLAAGKIS